MKKYTRRDFIKISGLATGAVILGCKEDQDTSLDLILQNGQLYMEGEFILGDIGIRNGRIVEIGESNSIIPDGNTKVIDCTGLYVSPGWVDLHIHLGEIGVGLDQVGTPMGVTAVFDAGTYGPETFSNLYENYCKNSIIPVYSFMNLRKDGIMFSNVYTPHTESVLNLDAAHQIMDKYPDIVKGIKVRTDNTNIDASDPELMARVSSEFSSQYNIPVMYHLGEPPPSIVTFLNHCKAGDIITHCFRENSNAVIDGTGSLYSEVINAKSNGICFDVGHGTASFCFNTINEALNQGLTDFTISSDLWQIPVANSAYTLANILSKCYAVGLTLEDIIYKCSEAPRTKFNLPAKIELMSKTDLTVFSVSEGDFTYTDVTTDTIDFDKRIIPEYAIVNGVDYRAGDRDRELFLS